jgi:hypothetical protein
MCSDCTTDVEVSRSQGQSLLEFGRLNASMNGESIL